jgi:hypothetical protein
MLPDPTKDSGFPFPTKYDPSQEPKFDAKIHLALENPDTVSILQNGNFKIVETYECKPNKTGSEFMFSNAFQLFTKEGSRVARQLRLTFSMFLFHYTIS